MFKKISLLSLYIFLTTAAKAEAMPDFYWFIPGFYW